MKVKMKIKRKMKMLVQCFSVAAEERKEREETKEGLREVEWEEIERSTRHGRVVGRGGSSTVYHLEEREEAVKLVYGRRVFEDELETLQRVADHPNIVKLKGYSRHPEDDQLAALVLNFAPNGTLQDSLLDWGSRVRVALQVADALDHLHHRCGPLPVVHGDIKASNVLLDRHLNAVLCDFGSARTGFSSSSSSSSQVMRGSPGYTDPHYLRTGIPSKKNDVYSFGVLLLHLLTGAAPFTAATGQLFPFPPPLDPRLHPSHHEAAAHLMDLASCCLSQPPALRPDASLIFNTISSSSLF